MLKLRGKLLVGQVQAHSGSIKQKERKKEESNLCLIIAQRFLAVFLNGNEMVGKQQKTTPFLLLSRCSELESILKMIIDQL